MGLRKGERQFAQRWKRKCLVNKCLLGHVETMEHRVDTIQACPPRPLNIQPTLFVGVSGDISIQGTGPPSKFVLKLKRKVKVSS